MVLDSRTHEEFVRMSIPTGISVPGGELVYRIGDIAPDPKTLVVVNCAGRTRSIMGAESLRRAGIPNKVVALRNGTMGWELAGFRCDRGRTDRFAAGTPKTAATALQRAQAFAENSGVGVIGAIDLARFEDDPDRTLYVLDVRDPAEYRAGHRPGSVSAPGGQLVQATDQWVGVRNARIVLVDDTGVRARMAGAWLRQMGHRDVFVVEGGLDAIRTTGRERLPVPELGAKVANDRRDRAGRTAGQRRGHHGDRSRAQHRFPRRPYPRRDLGRAHAPRRAEAATGRGEARGDHLARRFGGAARGGRGEGAEHGRRAGAGRRHRRLARVRPAIGEGSHHAAG